MGFSTANDDLARELGILQAEVRQAQALVTRGGILDQQGTLVPTLFSQFAPSQFDILPQHCVSRANSTNIWIEHNIYRTLFFSSLETLVDLTSGLKFYHFKEGIEAVSSNGIFQLSGQPGESIFLITGAIQWGTNSSGFRQLRILDALGDNTPLVAGPGMAGGGVVQSFAIIRQMFTTVSNIAIQAYQNMGTSLEITRAVGGVTRIR